MVHSRVSQAANRSVLVLVPTTLTELEMQYTRGQIFLAISVITLIYLLDLERPNLALGGEMRVSRGSGTTPI